jgi:hypothetical protein
VTDRALPPAGERSDVHVRADGSEHATLRRFGTAIEEVTGWKVILPVDHEDVRLSGEWRGTFEEIITEVPLSVGLAATTSARTTTITLSR